MAIESWVRLRARTSGAGGSASASESEAGGSASVSFSASESMEFRLPREHQPGMTVPKGGSSCSNCKFLGTRQGEAGHCNEPNFILWNKGSRITRSPGGAPVMDPETFCSDWWQSR